MRKRLNVAGDKESKVYDDAVFDAVKAFQMEAGIGVDGMLGPNTLRVLNGTQEAHRAPRDPVDLLSLVDDVRESLDQPIAARGVELIIETDATHPVVQGDRSQLVQLLANLVANALKYGREGRPIRVRLAQAAGDMLCVEVIDEGEGIAPEHLPRLTERFYRVEASRSRQAGGTGLGLAIVKHIVLRHRGRLDIASTLGTGTTVSVYLPRANVTEPSSR